MTYMRDFHRVLQLCGPEPPPYEEWRAFYSENTELWPLTDKQQNLVGGILFKGHLIHIAVAPQWQGRWLNKTILRAVKAWQPAADVIAAIPPDNAKALELVRRLGWKLRGTEEGFIVYVKEKATCPQS